MAELTVSFGFRRPVEPDRIGISFSYRVRLIKLGIEKAGSMNELGRKLGYRSRVHSGRGVVQIMPGKQAFPMDRLKLLAEFLGYSMEDILSYFTHPARVTPGSTKSALVMYGFSGYIPRLYWHRSAAEKMFIVSLP